MSKRIYLVHEIDKRVRRASEHFQPTAIGGGALLATNQHHIDGAEHLAASDITTLNASETAHGLMPKLSGSGDDVLLGDGTWGTITPDSVAQTPVTAALSNPPLESEIEAAVGFAPGAVPGQSWVLTDTDTERQYLVVSDGLVFKFLPLVHPASTGSFLMATAGGGWNDLHSLQQTAWYYNGKTYWVYLKDNGDIAIRAWTHSSQTASAEVILHSALSPADLHGSPVMLVRDSDKRIMVFYSSHNGAQMYLRISSSPESITAFAAEVDLDSQLGGASTEYTYPQVHQLLDETNDPIYLFYRRDPGGGSHEDQQWAWSKSTDDGVTWVTETLLFQEPSHGGYWSVWKTTETRIDFVCTSRAPFDESDGNLAHFYMEGGIYYQTDGTVISAGLPLETADMTLVHNPATSGANAADGSIALGIDGFPRVAFRVVETPTPTQDIRYWWGRWTGDAWETTEIVAAGVNAAWGNVSLDQSAPNVVYLGKAVSGTTEMFRYTTLDDGSTFIGEALTTASADDQVLLIPVHDAHPDLRLMWLSGPSSAYDAIGSGGASSITDERELSRLVTLVDTASNVEDGLASPTERVWAIATDTEALGYSDDGVTWTWLGGGGGPTTSHWEVLMTDGITSPPDPLLNEAEDDWLYGEVL